MVAALQINKQSMACNYEDNKNKLQVGLLLQLVLPGVFECLFLGSAAQITIHRLVTCLLLCNTVGIGP